MRLVRWLSDLLAVHGFGHAKCFLPIVPPGATLFHAFCEAIKEYLRRERGKVVPARCGRSMTLGPWTLLRTASGPRGAADAAAAPMPLLYLLFWL
mmetsp:Transcript_144549/g.204498  ORF Transcript_144549/g.204498 Transcript_144549/m.204498 type:complete len:95 (-) Transcript_144549:123-407(-)